MEEFLLNGIRFRHTEIREYYISEYGDVINLGNKKRKHQYMKQMTGSDGHKRVELKIEKGVGKKFSIHRMVYKVFIGKLIDGLVIEHLDGDPSNNHISNLKQSTQKENIRTAIEQGNWGNNTKRIKVKDNETNELYDFDSIREFFIFIKAPEYIIDNGGFRGIRKLRCYDKYERIS